MVRVAVIGCGAISHSHLRSYAANEGAQIVAVADPIQAVAEAHAQEYDTKAYTDYADMLRSEELHAVSICTPPPSHREITEHAAAHGLHVLCEKPLAMSVSEGEAMVAAAGSANVILMTAFCNRFYTPIAKAKEWIDSGKLGPLHHFRLRFAGVELMAGTWLADPARGGGILWESGPHYVDLFRYLVGEMKEIYAKGGTLAQDISRYRYRSIHGGECGRRGGHHGGKLVVAPYGEMRRSLRRTRRYRYQFCHQSQPL